MHRFMPLFWRELSDGGKMANSCIGDEHVEATKSFQGFGHCVLLRRKITHIGSDANDFARTYFGEFPSRGVGIFLAAAGDGHIEAFFEQAGGDTVADAFAAPGDEGGHLVEIVHMVVNVGSSEMVEIIKRFYWINY